MLSDERRQEIASFLRTRRARVTPEEVGLPPGRRRRVAGLRREEVAVLAGVSTEWYTWIEQARPVRASAEVLERIAVALRFEPSESRHLLTLGGYGAPLNGEARSHATCVRPHVRQLLKQLDPFPAWVAGERWDILAWNRAATLIYGDFAAMEEARRNLLCVLFLSPRIRRGLADWQLHARGVVAKVRSIYARYLGDPWYQEIIDLVTAESPEFAAWWQDHEIHPYEDGVKAFDLPETGPLSFDYSVLDLRDERLTLALTTYVPRPGTGTRETLERLLGAAPAGSRS
ncbi:MAG: helix-turn-helix domain-containing protein [Acidobacteria bacterium]|nr:helix-turn-helix domain-containing protein [Acidobacteriota bacterium]